MKRWVWTWAAAVAAGAAACGALGLAESVSQWVRFGPLADHPETGALRWILPTSTLYAWTGAALAAVLLPPAGLLLRRRRAPRRAAFAAAVAGALALLVALEAGYLLRERLLPDWWAAHGLGAGRLLLAVVVASALAALVPAAGALARRLARSRRAAFATGAAALVLLALLGLWPRWLAGATARRLQHLGTQPAAPAGAPNLVLVTIDAWRRDHLAVLDGRSPPTPALDALAREGVLYGNAWASAPWTLPSMGAIFSGLAPRALDVRKFRPLPSAVPLLAESAWGAGWATTAFATNPYLSIWYGFDRGFADFEHSLFLEPLVPAERAVLVREAQRFVHERFEPESADVVVPKAVRWLRRHGRERPFFLWVHLMNPHLPYRWRVMPPPAVPPDGLGVPPDSTAVPDSGEFAGCSFSALRPLREGRFVPGDPGWRAIRTLYAREVQFADAWAGRLLAELRDLGLWDRTVVVVTADHGEELNDHGGFEHGHSLLPEVTAVPLIVRHPGGPQGIRDEGVVSTLDLAPTCAAWFGWRLPPGAVGRPLPEWAPPGAATSASPAAMSAVASADAPADAVAAAGPTAVPARASPGDPADAAAAAEGPRLLVLESMLYGPPQRGLLAWPWLGVGPASSGGLAWYDLDVDRLARPPLPAPPAAASWLRRAAALQADWDTLAGRLRAGEKAQHGVPPADVQRQLESLGY